MKPRRAFVPPALRVLGYEECHHCERIVLVFPSFILEQSPALRGITIVPTCLDCFLNFAARWNGGFYDLNLHAALGAVHAAETANCKPSH